MDLAASYCSTYSMSPVSSLETIQMAAQGISGEHFVADCPLQRVGCSEYGIDVGRCWLVFDQTAHQSRSRRKGRESPARGGMSESRRVMQVKGIRGC